MTTFWRAVDMFTRERAHTISRGLGLILLAITGTVSAYLAVNHGDGPVWLLFVTLGLGLYLTRSGNALHHANDDVDVSAAPTPVLTPVSAPVSASAAPPAAAAVPTPRKRAAASRTKKTAVAPSDTRN